MPKCPAEDCDREIVEWDPDVMLAHLTVDHGWEWERANDFYVEEWPPMQEWDEPEPVPTEDT